MSACRWCRWCSRPRVGFNVSLSAANHRHMPLMMQSHGDESLSYTHDAPCCRGGSTACCFYQDRKHVSRCIRYSSSVHSLDETVTSRKALSGFSGYLSSLFFTGAQLINICDQKAEPVCFTSITSENHLIDAYRTRFSPDY